MLRRTILFALLIASCRLSPDVKSADQPVLASISTEPCFGPCPVYTAIVHTDGRLTFDGTVYDEGKTLKISRTIALDASQLKTLTDRFETSGFASWRDRYEYVTVTDNASITITWKNRKILHRLGDHSAPRALLELERDIPALFGISLFLAGEGGVEQ